MKKDINTEVNNEVKIKGQVLDKKTENFLYQIFPDMIRERLSDLPVQSLSTKEVIKNNGIRYYGIYAYLGENRYSPCVYLNSYIQDPVKEMAVTDWDEIADAMSHSLRRAISDADGFQIEGFSVEDIPERLELQMINSELNRELLKNLPHKDYLDLSIILIWIVKEGHKRGSIRINYDILKELGMDFEELYPIALKNMQQRYPYDFGHLEDMIRIMTGKDLCPGMSPFYCMTTERINNGCTVMLYPDSMRMAYDTIGEEFYIIPSSINEILLLPVSSGVDPDNLTDLISEVNREVVDPTEVLSDSLYIYRPEKDEIEIFSKPQKTIRFCSIV